MTKPMILIALGNVAVIVYFAWQCFERLSQVLNNLPL